LGSLSVFLLDEEALHADNMSMITLSPVRFLLLLAIGAGVTCGQDARALPVFEVASVKVAETPQGRGLAALREDIGTSAGTLTMRNVKLSTCIRWAYGLNLYEISGPDWIDTQRFDITAKPDHASTEDQLRLMLRTLLAERFHLVSHRQPKAVSGYALVVAKDQQPKLQAAEGGGEGSMTGAGMVFEGHKMPLSRLTDILSSALKEPVQDATELPGFYDFKLDLRPYITPPEPGQQLDIAGIAIAALRDELGLKLESRKITLDVLVVDSAEKTPTAN
jgi:uncharacterized protein (TIGR03435 family)